MIDGILKKIEKTQPFTDKEAWLLFKIAAISEACGWSLLIAGILIKRYVTPGNNVPVLIAGQVHGIIFLSYIVAVVVLYSSLNWSRKKTLVAGLASIPPYGSLVFEQWAAYKRRSEALKTYREIIVRAIIVQSDQVLAVQPKDIGFWNLPGGTVKANETMEQGLERTVEEQTGVRPLPGRLAYVLQYRTKATERLEMLYYISNSSDYVEADLIKKNKKSGSVEEIRYISSKGNKDLRPEFLQTEPLINSAKQQTSPVISVRLQ